MYKITKSQEDKQEDNAARKELKIPDSESQKVNVTHKTSTSETPTKGFSTSIKKTSNLDPHSESHKADALRVPSISSEVQSKKSPALTRRLPTLDSESQKADTSGKLSISSEVLPKKSPILARKANKLNPNLLKIVSAGINPGALLKPVASREEQTSEGSDVASDNAKVKENDSPKIDVEQGDCAFEHMKRMTDILPSDAQKARLELKRTKKPPSVPGKGHLKNVLSSKLSSGIEDDKNTDSAAYNADEFFKRMTPEEKSTAAVISESTSETSPRIIEEPKKDDVKILFGTLSVDKQSNAIVGEENNSGEAPQSQIIDSSAGNTSADEASSLAHKASGLASIDNVKPATAPKVLIGPRESIDANPNRGDSRDKFGKNFAESIKPEITLLSKGSAEQTDSDNIELDKEEEIVEMRSKGAITDEIRDCSRQTMFAVIRPGDGYKIKTVATNLNSKEKNTGLKKDTLTAGNIAGSDSVAVTSGNDKARSNAARDAFKTSKPSVETEIILKKSFKDVATEAMPAKNFKDASTETMSIASGGELNSACGANEAIGAIGGGHVTDSQLMRLRFVSFLNKYLEESSAPNVMKYAIDRSKTWNELKHINNDGCRYSKVCDALNKIVGEEDNQCLDKGNSERQSESDAFCSSMFVATDSGTRTKELEQKQISSRASEVENYMIEITALGRLFENVLTTKANKGGFKGLNNSKSDKPFRLSGTNSTLFACLGMDSVLNRDSVSNNYTGIDATDRGGESLEISVDDMLKSSLDEFIAIVSHNNASRSLNSSSADCIKTAAKKIGPSSPGLPKSELDNSSSASSATGKKAH